jgi:hypothetical protein
MCWHAADLVLADQRESMTAMRRFGIRFPIVSFSFLSSQQTSRLTFKPQNLFASLLSILFSPAQDQTESHKEQSRIQYFVFFTAPPLTRAA